MPLKLPTCDERRRLHVEPAHCGRMRGGRREPLLGFLTSSADLLPDVIEVTCKGWNDVITSSELKIFNLILIIVTTFLWLTGRWVNFLRSEL